MLALGANNGGGGRLQTSVVVLTKCDCFKMQVIENSVFVFGMLVIIIDFNCLYMHLPF